MTIHTHLRMSALALLVTLALVPGCKKEEAAAAPQMRGAPVFNVTTGAATTAPIISHAPLVGAVRWPQHVTVRSEVRGRVLSMAHREGISFKAGETLFELDSSDYKLALATAQAELFSAKEQLALARVGTRPEVIAQLKAGADQIDARLAQAKEDLARIKGLFEQSVRTQADLTAAEANYRAISAQLAEARARLDEANNGPIKETIAVADARVKALDVQVAMAQRDLDKCTIVAPFDGTVLATHSDLGAYVQVGEALVEIVSNENIEVVLDAPEQLVGAISRDAKFDLVADAYPTLTFKATVIAIIPMADAQTRNVKFRAVIEDPEHKLVEGMFVRSQFPVASKPDALLVPRDAITIQNDTKFVFVVGPMTRKDDAGQAVATYTGVNMVPVQVGLQGDGVVEVSGNLKSGDTVVTTGSEVLYPGAEVKDIAAAAAAAPGAPAAN